MAKKHEPHSHSTHRRPPSEAGTSPNPGNSEPIATGGPQFAEPTPTPDPTHFTVRHGSDTQAYKILDSEKGLLKARPFPVVEGVAEPVLTLAQALGAQGAQVVADIQKAGQIVFHCVGDTGNVKGPHTQELVADKMVADYDDRDYGYLRVLVDAKQLRIEYHPAPDGEAAKTPDDFVTVDLARRQLVHFQAR